MLAIAFGFTIPGIPFGGTVILATLFAFLTMMLLLALSYRLDFSLSTNTIILMGVIFSMFANSIISLIIGLALYFLVYNGLKKGKNWARILGTVLAAIAILSGIFGLFGVFIYPAPWNIIMAILMIVKVWDAFADLFAGLAA